MGRVKDRVGWQRSRDLEAVAAQGLDGQLRTAEPRHAALRYELERAAEVIAQLRSDLDAARQDAALQRSMLADEWASYERIEKDRDYWRKAALTAGADPVIRMTSEEVA